MIMRQIKLKNQANILYNSRSKNCFFKQVTCSDKPKNFKYCGKIFG